MSYGDLFKVGGKSLKLLAEYQIYHQVISVAKLLSLRKRPKDLILTRVEAILEIRAYFTLCRCSHKVYSDLPR